MKKPNIVSESLNFGWLIEGEIAGCASPMAADELYYLTSLGIGAVVRLANSSTDFVMDSKIVTASGLKDLHLPVKDYQAPTADQIEKALLFTREHVEAGVPVVISCGAGCGRTGTILACYLVTLGLSAEEALTHLVSKRPCSNEIITRTPAQKAAVYKFEQRYRAHSATSIK